LKSACVSGFIGSRRILTETMSLREQLEYGATAALLHISRLLPEGVILMLFRGFARFFFAVGARRRRLALRNTEIAFPERPLSERKVLVRQSYLNLAEGMAINMLILSRRITEERLLEMVVTDDWHKFEQHQDSDKNGWLVVTGHLGNWELMPQYVAQRLERQLHVIARQGNNRLLEERVVRPMRERFGVGVFYKKNALMRIVKAVGKGDVCGLLIDQKLNPPEGIRVDLFGRPAPTTPSAAVLQIRFGITVYPAFMVRERRLNYRMIIADPVEWEDNGKPLEEQVQELSRIHQRIIEDTVRKYPDQWFWAHNRWGLPKVK
jgi:KDO2-lipid IV(A) lauroyltransferase